MHVGAYNSVKTPNITYSWQTVSSSLLLFFLLLPAGLQTGLMPAQRLEPSKDSRTDKVNRHILAPKKELTVRREDAFITFFPESTQRLTYGIDESREALIIGKQWFSWAPSEDDHYRWQIAPARTYAPSLQVCMLFPSRCKLSFSPRMLLPSTYPAK